MSIKSTLEEARARIQNPNDWTKGDFGIHFDPKWGRMSVLPWSKSAECWCIRGAIYAAASSWTSENAAKAMMHVEQLLEKHTGWPSRLMANWNDHPQTTHNDVIGLLDRAIAEAPDE